MSGGAGDEIILSGLFWRVKYRHEAGDILGPARAPEGRWHAGGQRALYLSATPRGAVLGTRIYLRPGDPERAIYPLRVSGARVVDLRDAGATARFGIDTTRRTIDWQAFRARGEPAPTWAISDRVREIGLDGMIYASRAEPALTHLTLFRWNEDAESARVEPAGEPLPWSAGEAPLTTGASH